MTKRGRPKTKDNPISRANQRAVWIQDSDWDELDVFAKKQGRTKKSIVTEAIRQYTVGSKVTKELLGG